MHTSTNNDVLGTCALRGAFLPRLLVVLLFFAAGGISAPATPRITTHFDYDANHNVTNRVAGDGTVTVYGYDDVNRLIHIDNPGNEHDVSFSYNAGSLVTQVVDNTGITAFTYHPDFDWLLEARHPNGHFINYQYDPQGRLIHASGDNLPGVSVAYDVEDRVVRTTDALGASTRIYNPTTGQLSERKLSNGIRILFFYDPETGEVTGISQYKPDGSLIADITYQYYADGMLEVEAEATPLGVRSISYQYDDLWRLTNVTHSTGRVEEYEYDANGNRMRKMVTENGTVTEDTLYRYNRINQIAQAGDEVLFHDGRGNIVRRVQPDADTGEMRETRYGWSPDNRLISVEEVVDGVTVKTVRYQYDGFRKRVAKRVTINGDTTTTEYVNNDALLYSPVLEYKNGLLKREYLADGYIDGGRAKYELVSLGGGVRVFDDNGTEVASVQYDSFGNAMAAAGDASRVDHWKGEFLDPDTGLVYLRNRWYDPALGRFLSLDAHPGFLYRPQTLNPYLYCANNPVNIRDPLGLDSVFVYGGGTAWENINAAGVSRSFDYTIQSSAPADAARALTQLANSGVSIDRLVILGHGAEGYAEVGSEMLSPVRISPPPASIPIEQIGNAVSPGGVIELWTCNTAGIHGCMNGPQYLQALANAANRPVIAQTGRTFIIPFLWDVVRFGEQRRYDPARPPNCDE